MSRQHVRLLLLTSVTVVSGRAAYVPLDFSSQVNSRMQNYAGAAASYPEGGVTLGGVPFSIPTGGNNVWHSLVPGGPNPRTLAIPVNLFGVDTVHTLINTGWGEMVSGTYASVRFLGSGGLDHTVALDGNVDIRDYLQNVYANSINGTTTEQVFTAGSGLLSQVRLDKQVFDLPAAFETATLLSIVLSDNGDTGLQRVFLAGATAQTVPEPGAWAALAGLGLLSFGVWRRSRPAAK